MIALKESENGVYQIGQFYIWLTEDGQIGNFSYYLSKDAAKEDQEEYYEKISESYAAYWAGRCPPC